MGGVDSSSLGGSIAPGLPWCKRNRARAVSPEPCPNCRILRKVNALSSVTKLGLSTLPVCLVSTVELCLPSLPLGLLLYTQPEETAHSVSERGLSVGTEHTQTPNSQHKGDVLSW